MTHVWHPNAARRNLCRANRAGTPRRKNDQHEDDATGEQQQVLTQTGFGQLTVPGVPVPGVPVISPVAVITPPAAGAAPDDELEPGAFATERTEVFVGAGVSVGDRVLVGLTVGVVAATLIANVGATAGLGDKPFKQKNAPTAMMPMTNKPPKPIAMMRNNRLGPPPAGAILPY